MILKSFQIKNIDIEKNNFYLFYGDNKGAKSDAINFIVKKFSPNCLKYDEEEILINKDSFLEEIFNKSLFEPLKSIVISRISEKILPIIQEIYERNIIDTKIIINADLLEKKSKLRNFFEKEKKAICVPFYPENELSLIQISSQFCKKNNINISQENLNIIINRSRNDRINLVNELEKIKNFCFEKRKINTEEIMKLTNMSENYSVNELVDNCLSKNKLKTLKILNENNYNSQDCFFIIRSFLNKSKRLNSLKENYEINKNIDETISNFKPPVFWKDKDIVKTQMKSWSSENIKNLIFEISRIEKDIKKHSENSLRILTNFILSTVSKPNNVS